MTDTIRIDPKIADHVDAAIKAGFIVYATPSSPWATGWVALCMDEAGPWAHIQKPTHTFDPVQLDVPIKPSREYGSSVHVDHDGTPAHAVEVLRTACSEETVTVRFMTKQYIAKHGVPRVPNHGRKCLDHWKDVAVKLGERGTNWESTQQAQRLDVGDRFLFSARIGGDGSTVEVESRRYTGPDYDTTVVTATDGRTITLPKGTVVTLAGAA
jgi:hypothetical protein